MNRKKKGSSSFILHPSSLPLDAAFFGGVDLGLLGHWQRLVEEVALDVVEQKILRVRVGQVETVMIDDLRLLPQCLHLILSAIFNSLKQFRV
jgi:hypothetical protein